MTRYFSGVCFDQRTFDETTLTKYTRLYYLQYIVFAINYLLFNHSGQTQNTFGQKDV